MNPWFGQGDLLLGAEYEACRARTKRLAPGVW